MQVINDRPTCIACKKTFMESTKENWRLLPIHKVKDVLEIDVDFKKDSISACFVERACRK